MAQTERKIRLTSGHFYAISDTDGQYLAEYIGREGEYTRFNVWCEPDGGYQTRAYDGKHMPTVLQDLGKANIVCEQAGWKS